MSKYSRGADFERAVVKHLKKEGYLAFRCAGSKGNQKTDVIAIPPHPFPLPSNPKYVTDATLLIQCKLSGRISNSEKDILSKAAIVFHCIPILASKINGNLNFDTIPKWKKK